jgi:hypothetical protein
VRHDRDSREKKRVIFAQIFFFLNFFVSKGLDVYAVYAHRQYLTGKVRTFVDFLAGYIGSPPYWDTADPRQSQLDG